jgi:hypothetical protein
MHRNDGRVSKQDGAEESATGLPKKNAGGETKPEVWRGRIGKPLKNANKASSLAFAPPRLPKTAIDRSTGPTMMNIPSQSPEEQLPSTPEGAYKGAGLPDGSPEISRVFKGLQSTVHTGPGLERTVPSASTKPSAEAVDWWTEGAPASSKVPGLQSPKQSAEVLQRSLVSSTQSSSADWGLDRNLPEGLYKQPEWMPEGAFKETDLQDVSPAEEVPFNIVWDKSASEPLFDTKDVKGKGLLHDSAAASQGVGVAAGVLHNSAESRAAPRKKRNKWQKGGYRGTH